MLTIPNYQILTQIHESNSSFVYKAIKKENNQSVILKILKKEYPTPEELARYRQEYEMISRLNEIEGVINAYSLEKHQNQLIICLEDVGGESLKHHLAQSTFSLAELLRLAILLTDILGHIHQQNIIHKDINPANWILNPNTWQVKLIDFGIASVLPRENPTLKNPNQLEGTLAYISPEQTGRMNRALDYRSDFYSLGVTFYELFTGKVPFETTDAMELVHSHIAIKPPSPVDLNPELPMALSDIIMKLLEKTAEARYQSAWGLKADLQKCQELLALDHKKSFTLGQQDFSDQFQLPQKLYGRELEVEALLAAFERVTSPSSLETGKAEMMLVAGFSGVGKSVLVQEIYRPITKKHGYFISGKFDQLQRNIPYSAIVSALRDLVRQLLTESQAQLTNWKEKILSAVGNNGQVIVDVIPEVALIVGTTSPVPTLGPTETQNRFNLVFQNFMKVFAQPAHPLVIFLDDLQWADSASLKLMQLIMTTAEKQALFLIGAYRDNEVSATHPLMFTLEEVQKTEAVVNRIFLSPLELHHVNQLVADALHCWAETAYPLAELVYTKTGGNPFFLNEFLKSLYVEGLLKFEVKLGDWQWDLPSIQARGFTDNVVELMVGNIQQLPIETQQLLQLASCIGNQFDITTLARVAEQRPHETVVQLQHAVIKGQLSIIDSQPVTEQKQVVTNELLITTHYRFTHDRIQQAAYSLIPQAQKQQVHHQIGQLLLQNTLPKEREQHIFAIVDQLNVGIAVIESQSEREQLAELNLIAGQKAKASTAYQPAFDYLNIGLGLLEEDSWQSQYKLMLALHLDGVEAAYLSGHFEQMEQLAQKVQQHAISALDKVKVYEIQVLAYAAQHKQTEAIKIALSALKMLGIKFPNKPSSWVLLQNQLQVRLALTGKQIEDLSLLPIMTHLEKLAAMRLLSIVIASAYQVAPELLPLVILKQVILSIKYGNAPESAFAYTLYGNILCGTREIDKGYQFGQLALGLLERLEAKQVKARTYLITSLGILHWKELIKNNLQLFLEGYQSGIETGDFEFGAFCACDYSVVPYVIGQNLTTLEQQMASYIEAIDQINQPVASNYVRLFRQAVLNLIKITDSPAKLKGASYDETMLRQQNHEEVFLLHFHKLILNCLFGKYHQAYEHAKIAEKNVSSQGMIWYPFLLFYDSLVRLARYFDHPKSEQSACLKKVAVNQKKMKKWAHHAPMNYQHKFYLVEAERCRVLGFDKEAREYYDLAIESAHKNEYLNEEALAYELAGQFYLAKNKFKMAQVYLRDAHYVYQQWGALAKVNALENKHPQLFVKTDTQSTQTTPTTIPTASSTSINSTSLAYSSQLDLSSVVKASQALLGEIVLERLFTKMMHLVIENAGAEKGFLLLPDKEQWFIEAENDVKGHHIKVLQSIPIEQHQQIPSTLIHYVARTQENVVLDNASVEGKFQRDPYIVEYHPKSVLCAPLLNQGRLAGILYLENNLTKEAFTPDRLQVLQMLSSQIAISIENALLYRNLEQKVEERTAELAEAKQQIEKLNEELTDENQRMKAELNVSRHLQQMLLPQKKELSQIEGLDIAGLMEPADEVGGDYYDVLQHQGHVLFTMGDVTGHGLESGALAIMVQASVRTLLANNETDSVKFLSALNQMVYYNVERMNAEKQEVGKTLSLILVDYFENQLYISGQHEELIVVRQGELELIDTMDLGFPIGLDKQIANYISQTTIPLNSGDVVALYTDGITEAENLEGEQYGLERLGEMIQQNWQCTAREIQERVIHDVRQFIGEQEVFDDITLLILKRK